MRGFPAAFGGGDLAAFRWEDAYKWLIIIGYLWVRVDCRGGVGFLFLALRMAPMQNCAGGDSGTEAFRLRRPVAGGRAGVRVASPAIGRNWPGD
jgi:hypothetical protein